MSHCRGFDSPLKREREIDRLERQRDGERKWQNRCLSTLGRRRREESGEPVYLEKEKERWREREKGEREGWNCRQEGTSPSYRIIDTFLSSSSVLHLPPVLCVCGASLNCGNKTARYFSSSFSPSVLLPVFRRHSFLSSRCWGGVLFSRPVHCC